MAEGRYLSDELTLHYGLVPRTNRGIFAINELPDLAERIQVGLLNVLEERDVQIRGYKIRLPLDVMLVASANPEDYTNRGRIITPLKDRFGAQIRTHYPLDVETELQVVAPGGPSLERPGPAGRRCPTFMAEIVGHLSHLARQSPHINQRSGVSVRLSIANYETLVANAARRALRLGETDVVPRVSDLEALVAVDGGQGRDRDARGGPGRPGRRPAAQAGRADRVQGPVPDGAVPRRGRGLRRGHGRPRRRRRRLAPPTSRCWPHARAASAGHGPGRRARRRPRWPGPPSSCSRASTCPSGSTRKPRAARATYRAPPG